MDREPLLPAFHRRGVLPTPSADRSLISVPLEGRLGEEGVEWLLTQTIRLGQTSGAIDHCRLKQVAVDTTVMEKAIAHPTESRLLDRGRSQLVALAQELEGDLRQSYITTKPVPVLQLLRQPVKGQTRSMPCMRRSELQCQRQGASAL